MESQTYPKFVVSADPLFVSTGFGPTPMVPDSAVPDPRRRVQFPSELAAPRRFWDDSDYRSPSPESEVQFRRRRLLPSIPAAAASGGLRLLRSPTVQPGQTDDTLANLSTVVRDALRAVVSEVRSQTSSGVGQTVGEAQDRRTSESRDPQHLLRRRSRQSPL